LIMPVTYASSLAQGVFFISSVHNTLHILKSFGNFDPTGYRWEPIPDAVISACADRGPSFNWTFTKDILAANAAVPQSLLLFVEDPNKEKRDCPAAIGGNPAGKPPFLELKLVNGIIQVLARRKRKARFVGGRQCRVPHRISCLLSNCVVLRGPTP
jgi:hypothetical protein